MVKWLSKGFWATVARIILRNRIIILTIIAAITVVMGMQWKYMRFTYTEANLLPDEHPVNQEYNKFLEVFGEEGNLIILAVKDQRLFTPENFNQWNKLSKKLNAFPEIDMVVSTENLHELVKDTIKQEFTLKPLILSNINSQAAIDSIKTKLFEQLPFYESLLFNKETQTLRTAVYMDKEIVNTSVRKDFIYNDLLLLSILLKKKQDLMYVHLECPIYVH